MGIKVHPVKFEDGTDRYQWWFWCPGCENYHAFTVPPWTMTGSLEAPSFEPSLLCNRDFPSSRCHAVVTSGKIAFQADCWHALKSQTVEMQDWKGFGEPLEADDDLYQAMNDLRPDE